MNSGHQVHVSIGEVKIGRGDDVLSASLGSCVGIGLLWKSRKIYGLAHCLLPETLTEKTTIGGRFVNQAIASLLILMKIHQEHYSEIEAVIAGGGNMTSPKGIEPDKLVGTLNAKAAESGLNQLGIRIIYKELGGDVGRKIIITCVNSNFVIKPIPRILNGAA